MSLVRISSINKSYTTGKEKTHVLRGADLEMDSGEMVMVMGPSGSGKTTLLNLIGGIDRADSGSINVDGQEITGLGRKELSRFRREKVGFIFQFYNLIPTLTARENVELGMEFLDMDRAKIRDKSASYLDMVGLGDKMDNYPQELSGGEQQRVAIARALAKEPAMILADEPTGNVDEEREASIMRIMQDLKRKLSMTFLIVSHNSRLSGYMDRILYLRHGKIHEDRG